MATTSPRGVATNAVHAAGGDRWSPEQAAEYTARRDFRLIQLLSRDRRALAAARRLGIFAKQVRGLADGGDQSHGVARPLRRAAQTQTMRSPEGNARQRRSNRRAAAHRAAQAEVEAADAMVTQSTATSTMLPSFAAALGTPAPASTPTMLPAQPAPPPPPHSTRTTPTASVGAGTAEAMDADEPPSSPSRDFARQEQLLLHDASVTLAARARSTRPLFTHLGARDDHVGAEARPGPADGARGNVRTHPPDAGRGGHGRGFGGKGSPRGDALHEHQRPLGRGGGDKGKGRAGTKGGGRGRGDVREPPPAPSRQ